MSMPEAAMHKDDGLVFAQHQVRFAGEFFIVQPVTKAICMQEFTHQHFRLRILAFNAAHIVATGCYAVYIGHGIKVSYQLK